MFTGDCHWQETWSQGIIKYLLTETDLEEWVRVWCWQPWCSICDNYAEPHSAALSLVRLSWIVETTSWACCWQGLRHKYGDWTLFWTFTIMLQSFSYLFCTSSLKMPVKQYIWEVWMVMASKGLDRNVDSNIVIWSWSSSAAILAHHHWP